MSLSINEIILILMQKGTYFIRISLLLQQLMKSLKYFATQINENYGCITSVSQPFLAKY